MSHKTRKARGEPLPPNLVRHVRDLLESIGEAPTLARLRISKNALYRALARMPVLAGTHALIAADVARASGDALPRPLIAVVHDPSVVGARAAGALDGDVRAPKLAGGLPLRTGDQR